MSTRRRQIPASVRETVFRAYGSSCWLRFPGCDIRADTLDHIYPDRLDGSDMPRNLRPACRHCNSARHDRLIQGRGIMAAIHLTTPYEDGVAVPDGALLLDWRDCWRMVGVDGNTGWILMQGMWRGLVYEALRTPNMMPLVLAPPPDTTASQVREWIRLGYQVECGPIGKHTVRASSCEAEARAWQSWRRSWLGQTTIDRLMIEREADWRRFGLVF
ncbi:HNH endonuclease [Bifidobacterium lemurum]|uniref:HNH endonuclease n=1 Tax=Bifidobacterium lemurum TaxID=1603886 RepID=A0A261FU16_9BIFI|nr:HNH endonuclease signature motif containing protein [Bifidobacterium lemurum]OZG62681.1 HNH endonuclease [Bifidobacterium lemurum]QOL34602.1 HNH endonuclease [Bifidobacterium lemurum]